MVTVFFDAVAHSFTPRQNHSAGDFKKHPATEYRDFPRSSAQKRFPLPLAPFILFEFRVLFDDVTMIAGQNDRPARLLRGGKKLFEHREFRHPPRSWYARLGEPIIQDSF